MTQTTRLLKYVRTHGGKSAYQIAVALGLDPSSTSSMLKRLCDRALLYREPYGGPRKGYIYYATYGER